MAKRKGKNITISPRSWSWLNNMKGLVDYKKSTRVGLTEIVEGLIAHWEKTAGGDVDVFVEDHPEVFLD